MAETADIFRASYERCIAVPNFLDLFYERFIYSSDEVARKFENTEFRRQKTILSLSLKMLAHAYQGDAGANDYLNFLAARHSRAEIDVPPELYELWLDALLSTVQSVDPQFNHETEAVWEAVMRYGIERMSQAY